MWWRLKRSEFVKGKGDSNKNAFRGIVKSGGSPGVLAYAAGRPIAWCALAPRSQYPVFERSRVLAPVDTEPVWSVTCFFVAKDWRGKGVTVELLKAAVNFAVQHGAKIIEGYPVDPKKSPMPSTFAYTGLPGIFKKAGFVEVLRRSETRPIMRYVVDALPMAAKSKNRASGARRK